MRRHESANNSSVSIHRPDLRRRFGRTAHFLRHPRDQHLALVEGEPALSTLFARAVPLGDGRDCLLRDLAGLGYQGSLLRAVGHWIRTAAGLSSLEAWLQDGPASLLREDTRIIPIASTLRPVRKTGDLAVDDRRPRDGDWIIALAESDSGRIQAFARVNRVVRLRERSRALSSIYWYFTDEGPVLDGALYRRAARKRMIVDESLIRRLVARFYNQYRAGLRREAPRRELRRCTTKDAMMP